MKNLIRAAAFAPRVTVGGVESNRAQLAAQLREAAEQGCDLAVFPELCLTGSTAGDLFLQPLMTDCAFAALTELAALTDAGIATVVGLPLRLDGRLYDCAAVLQGGRLRGLVPKRRLSARERRYFSPYFDAPREILLPDGGVCMFGDVVFDFGGGFTLGAAIGDDRADGGAGAVVIACPAAEHELVGRAERRRVLLAARSADGQCAVVCANAGEGESTTDHVFGGHCVICENGHVRREAPPFSGEGVLYDVDPGFLLRERELAGEDTAAPIRAAVCRCDARRSEKTSLLRDCTPLPFVPADAAERARRCRAILDMQAAGLRQRLLHTRAKRCVIGISGGLDSTLALLVTAQTYASLGMPASDILCITMPGFGTTARTKSNALLLCETLGVSLREVPIADAVRVHFRDIGHDEDKRDVTYENAQARERTQVLMDIANACGGLVIGTGDLSELALGWATYNGDHMSMYGVNASVPKTLVRHLVAHCAAEGSPALRSVLEDILATPVSPELLPPENGDISQKTEELVGPYELHDFYLYHFLRCGYPPAKLLAAAMQAFAGVYTRETLLRWMETFFRRFFAQQFKRSCLPDGPKVGSVGVSPRGDLCLPSDASAELWLREIEALKAQ